MANKLLAAGYTDVRRYQLGIPIWRILVGLTEIELEGILYAVGKDQTTVLIDARNPQQFKTDTLPEAVNLLLSGVNPGKKDDEIKKTKGDGRLPVKDHNTRIIPLDETAPKQRPWLKHWPRRHHSVTFLILPELLRRFAYPLNNLAQASLLITSGF